MSSSTAPSHVTESITDRKKSRELAEARQSGQVAPQVDVKTGAMINPHNPEFITKRPWYLGGDHDAGPSLDHQADATKDKVLLSLQSADALVQAERQKLHQKARQGKLEVGMWVEAMRHGKGPYRMCQIIKMAKKGTEFDLQYDDGTVERKVKFKPSSSSKNNKTLFHKPRIRITKTGARTIQIDEKKHGKETYDSKRDKYHGYDKEHHTKKVAQVFQEREELRKQLRQAKQQKQELQDEAKDTATNATAENTTTQTETHNNNNNNNTNENGRAGRGSDSDSDSDLDSDVDGSDDSDDEFVQRDEDERVITTRLARQGGVGGAQMKVTARNLRIREDTAKYLRNLDPNSAYYDPKSRSMRDNPNPEIAPDESQFAGDNFARISGDAVQLAETQLFAWDATEKAATTELHPQANPSQVELLQKKFQTQSAAIQMQKKRKVLDKYGGQEYLDGSGGLANAIDDDTTNNNNANGNSRWETQANKIKERAIRFGVSSVAQEYSRDGRIVKGPLAVAGGGSGQQQRNANHFVGSTKSKYEEDVFINGHTTVWGSYFHIGAFQWGYADDHSLLKNSYCTGEAGRQANDEAHEMRYGTGVAGSAALAQARGMLKSAMSSKNNNQGRGEGTSHKETASRMYGEADVKAVVDSTKVQQALEKLDNEQQQQQQQHGKRKYNSLNASEVDVTEEEMEAYRLRKERGADPMANIGTDELLDYK